jgi:polysaccharide pyruvyl transferase WcaK-like protein
MRSRARRVAVYGFLGSGNVGNDASFETVLEWLRVEHPDVAVRCITLAPAAIEAKYAVPSVSLSWQRPRPGAGRVASAAGKLLGRLVDVPRSMALAGSVDVVIVPGMGVLEESLGVVPWGLPTWMFLIAAACRLRRRRFVLLDVGAEPVGNPLTRRLFVATVGLATHVSYRDSWSAESMRRAGARAPDAVAPDLAFRHPSRSCEEPEPAVLVIGVMAYYGRGDDRARGADLHRRYVGSLADAVVRFTDAGDRVVLVGGDRVDVDVAYEVQRAVRAARPALAGSAVAVPEVTGFAEISDEMARAEVVVASRFHNLIGALRVARPTVSVGYAQKNARLMQELGLAEYCQDIEDLDAERLVSQVRRAQAEGASLSARISAATGRYDRQVGALLDLVAVGELGTACPEHVEVL